MNEQDLKYLIASYQQKSFDLFSQSVANEAKIRQLNELVESLTKQINDQNTELEKLKTKVRKPTSNKQEDFT